MTEWILLGVLILLAIGMSIFFYYQRQTIEFYKIQEQELDQYAVEVETVYTQMRGIRHDYRNHLHVMRSLMRDQKYEEVATYIDQLNNELNQVDSIIRTGNTMIDAIVNTKLTAAKHAGIDCYATAIAPKELEIDSIDLAIILGNLLNNAIEATTKKAKAKNLDEQFIRLYILNYSYLFVRTSIYPALIPFTTLFIVHPLGEVKKIQKEHTL